MQEESRLSFSANGSGVSLGTKYGTLNFSTEEYSYYSNLFKLADSTNKGVLLLNSSQLLTLLVRTNMSWNSLEKAINIVSSVVSLSNGTLSPSSSSPGSSYLGSVTTSSSASIDGAVTPGDANATPSAIVQVDLVEKGIKPQSWLMLCKLLAYSREVRRDPSEKMMKNLHSFTTKKDVPFLSFQLGQAVKEFEAGKVYKTFKVEIKGWQFYGDDFQSQHAKFQLVVNSMVYNETPMNVSQLHEKFQVERRYSEFESFASILQRNYPGNVIPPLPSKNWKFTQNESQTNQRAQEFQMFLDYILVHPVLMYSYELQIFLEASISGMKACGDLYQYIDRGEVDFQKMLKGDDDDYDQVSKLLVESAQVVSTNASKLVQSNKAVEFLSSIWGTVTKNIAAFTNSSPVHSLGPEDEQLFHKTIQFLDAMAACGKKLESVVQAKSGYYYELLKIAKAWKSMSEFEPMPDLVKVLQTSSTVYATIAKAEQESIDRSTSRVVIPINYLGKYSDGFRYTLQQHTTLLEDLNTAFRQEAHAKQRVDQLSTQLATSVEHTPSVEGKGEKEENPLNQAKLALAEAEYTYDQKKHEEEIMTQSVRSECFRIENMEKKNILDFLVKFTKEQIESTHQTLQYWEVLQETLQG